MDRLALLLVIFLRIRHHGIHQQKKTPFGEYVVETSSICIFSSKAKIWDVSLKFRNTLPETNSSSPLKMGGWNTFSFPFGAFKPIFRWLLLLVSGRVRIIFKFRMLSNYPPFNLN